jgi:hypothetical protein
MIETAILFEQKQCATHNVKHSYVWVISKFELDIKADGKFTIVKKIPKGETQETIVADDKNLFNGDCTIEKAQKFLDENYPNHLVLSVRNN